MLRSCLILAACLASSLAFAGSLTISITSAPVTGSKTYALSDADAAKFIAWAQGAYPTTNLDGSQATPTAAIALGRWADGIIAGTIANVTSAAKSAAATNAATAVAPIDIH